MLSLKKRLKMQIKFIKEFTSPVFGNVYVTKEVDVDKKTAEKYISAGVAELVNEAKQEKKEVKNVNSKPKFSKKSPKGRSKRRG
jgi:ABC-type arginine transport system ATPase subunit